MKRFEVNFWRCNLTKQIRIGTWGDNGVFHVVRTVKVKRSEFTGYEANAAYNIAERLNRPVARR